MSAQARRKKCDHIWKWARDNWLSHGKPWDLASILPSTVMRCPQPPKQRSTNQTEASSTEAQKPTQPSANHNTCVCQSVWSLLQITCSKQSEIRIQHRKETCCFRKNVSPTGWGLMTLAGLERMTSEAGGAMAWWSHGTSSHVRLNWCQQPPDTASYCPV